MPRSRAEGLLDSLRTVYYSHPQRLIGLALTCVGYTAYFLYGSVRCAGFTTSYSRVMFITRKPGHVCQPLEHGCEPQNDYLPPHLRMDKLSYLDLPDTQLVVPPLLNMIPDHSAPSDSEITEMSGVADKITFGNSTDILQLNIKKIHPMVVSTKNRSLPITPEAIEAMRKNIGSLPK